MNTYRVHAGTAFQAGPLEDGKQVGLDVEDSCHGVRIIGTREQMTTLAMEIIEGVKKAREVVLAKYPPPPDHRELEKDLEEDCRCINGNCEMYGH